MIKIQNFMMRNNKKMPKSTLNHRVANRTEKHGENTTDQKLSVEHTQGLYDY